MVLPLQASTANRRIGLHIKNSVVTGTISIVNPKTGSKHEGQLELITWVCKEEGVGFGSCFLDECDDLKKSFETKFEGNLDKFYKYRPPMDVVWNIRRYQFWLRSPWNGF